jgi:membrane-bound lytic murein transglycosylase MltF
MQQNRALQQLTADNEISVVWSEATDAREKDFLPIRIPIDKGLLGWRIFLIDKKNAAQFAQLQTLNQIKSLAAGQQHDWPDVQILVANGLKVDSSMDYPSLFKMLSAGRIDYLPRSILEIWDEEQTHAGMNLVVEKTIALQYPAAEYFFVSRGNKALAAALEKGLRAAIKDGSFERIFTKYNGKAIKLAKLKTRKLFKLKNPILQNEMLFEERDLRQDKDEAATN